MSATHRVGEPQRVLVPVTVELVIAAEWVALPLGLTREKAVRQPVKSALVE